MFIHALKYLMCDKLSLVVCKKRDHSTPYQRTAMKAGSQLKNSILIRDFL